MRLFHAALPLFEDEPGSAGGGPPLDPGAPFVHGEPPEKPAAGKAAEKSDIEKRLDALERDNAALRKKNDELSESERYWAQRARGGDRDDAPADDAGEFDPDPEIPAGRAADVQEETPEALLDDLSAKGLKALKARGLITDDELEKRLEKIRQQTEQRIAIAEADASWSTSFAQEFPEIAADNARMNRGEKPQSELFQRASAIFREMVADDPSLKKSQGALTAAARAAKRELAAEKKAMENDRDERRARIDAQRPERDRSRNDDDDGEPHVSRLGQQVIGHLSRFGVTEESYRDHQGAENRNGMKHVGGRRG
jgi:hypothetical protein